MSPGERPPGTTVAVAGLLDLGGYPGMGPGSRHSVSDSETRGSEEQGSPVFDESGRLLDGASARKLSSDRSQATVTHVSSTAASGASTALPSSPRTSEASSGPGDAEVLEDTAFQRAVSSTPDVTPSSAPPAEGATPATAACKQPPSGLDSAPRIAMLINGSDGDVRPMIALAKHLTQTYGHSARIFTNVNMVELCHRHCVQAVSVFSNSQEVLERAGGLSSTNGVLEAMRKPWKEAKLWAKEHPGACMAAGKAMMEFSPHVVLLGTQALAEAMVFEDRYGVPVLPVYLSRPYLEVDFIRQVAESEPPRPSFFAHCKAIDEGPTGLRRLVHTGAWALEEGEPSEAELSPTGSLGRLRAFLRDGPPPVCFGWGSMVSDEKLQPEHMLRLVVTALKEIGRRGVVIGGWMRLHERGREVLDWWSRSDDADLLELASFAEQEVCFVPEAPHEWLFPQCCCVVHHGGVGTGHAALRSGVPSVITPVCADQFSFAAKISELNVGIGLEALRDLTLAQLVRGLKRATEEMVARSLADLSARMLREEQKALPQAGSVIDNFVRRTAMTGQWARSLAQLNGKTRTPLSPVLGLQAAPKPLRKVGAQAKAATRAPTTPSSTAPKKEVASAAPILKTEAEASPKAEDLEVAPAPILKTEAETSPKVEDLKVDIPPLCSPSGSSMGSVSTQGRGQEPGEVEAATPDAGSEAKAMPVATLAPELKAEAPAAELTLSKAFALQYELWAAYSSKEFQAKLGVSESRTGSLTTDRSRLCLDVQKAVLPKYGFEGGPRGVSAMSQAVKQHYLDKEFLMRTVLINNILDLGPSVVTPPREATPVMRELPASLRRSAGFSRLVRVKLASASSSKEINIPACDDTTLSDFHWFLAHNYGADESVLRSCGFVELAPDGSHISSLYPEDRLPDRMGIEAEEWPFMPVTTPPETFLGMSRLRAIHNALIAAVSDGTLARRANTHKEENYQHMKSRLTRQTIVRVIPQFGFPGTPRGVRMATSAFFVHTWHPEVLSWLEEFETAVSKALPWRLAEGGHGLMGDRLPQPQAQQLRRLGA